MEYSFFENTDALSKVIKTDKGTLVIQLHPKDFTALFADMLVRHCKENTLQIVREVDANYQKAMTLMNFLQTQKDISEEQRIKYHEVIIELMKVAKLEYQEIERKKESDNLPTN